MKYPALAPPEIKNAVRRYADSAFRYLLAVAWITKGLFSWCVILGVPLHHIMPFEDMSVLARIVFVIFSNLDVVAGVALWLSPVWGSTLWLVACLAECVRQLASAPSILREASLGVLLLLLLLHFLFRYAAKRAVGDALR